jgi:chromosome segregation ATPase
MISLLEDQIDDRDEKIEQLQADYETLVEQEEALLQEIEELDAQVTTVVATITAGTATIESIQTETIDMGKAIAIITENTRSVVSKSRGLLANPDERPN